MAATSDPASGPSVLDALALLVRAGEDVALATARDTHGAITDRVHGGVRHGIGQAGRPAELLERGIAAGVYGTVGAALSGVARGLDRWAQTGAGPRLPANTRGRFVTAALNGLIGDELRDEGNRLAIAMSARRGHRDVTPDRRGLAMAYPEATGKVAVFLHGLCEDESCWDRDRERAGTTHPQTLAEVGWTPVVVRYNSGLAVRDNAAAFASLVDTLVDNWPVPVERIALVGHSMGGLVARAATVVALGTDLDSPWIDRLSDLVTLGSPHLGSRIAVGASGGSRLLRVLPGSAAFSHRVLERRSAGIRDLDRGLGYDVPPLAHVRYRLVAATLTRSARHPVGAVVGDVLVHPTSAVGRGRSGREVLPGADHLHVGQTGHFGLLNHPDVRAALRGWLADAPIADPSAVGEQGAGTRGFEGGDG